MIFFPQRPHLCLDGHGYSPALLHRIVAAGGEAKSFAQAARLLNLLAELPLSSRHVGRLTAEIGAELQARQHAHATAYQRRQLAPAVPQTPRAVVVEVDGGRVQTRTPDAGAGVHAPHWREDQVACLATLHSAAQEADPHPAVPPCYVDPEAVGKSVQQLPAQGSAATAREAATTAPVPTAATAAAAPRWQPVRLVRTVVATLPNSAAFGPLVAGEAQRRGFFAAERAAVVADGQH
jgi:hypothetical protein